LCRILFLKLLPTKINSSIIPILKPGFLQSPESNYSEGEIEKAIDSLSDEFRIPFRMHIEGYKYKEIADELGLKIGTVKSRIFFTRQKLMLILKDYVR
jgi:DNA-directed RNA polymerase specialized sigma24 family protein